VIAARAAAMFGLPGNPPAAAAASRNKLASRAAFRRAGLPTPSFEAIALADDAAVIAGRTSYPAVIKPLALSGSRGVMRVDSAAEFIAAVSRLRRLLQAPDIRADRDAAHDEAMVEAFVPGAEFAVEGVLTGGAFQLFAIFDKPDPLDGPFFEETIYVTPSRQPEAVQRQIRDGVAAAARALGLYHGPVHAECRVNEAGVFVLEVAARPIGGLCSRTLRFVDRSAASGATPQPARVAVPADASGDARAPQLSLEEVLLRHAIGEDISRWTREPAASAVMMIPIPRRGVLRGVSGVDEARAIADVDDVRITAKPDTVLVPLPEGRSYLGFIFARAATAAAADQALRSAHAVLRFAIDRELDVI
jgi:formate-dependent phosphoribosylglycinamide formyltransferase (GAR transformylase)